MSLYPGKISLFLSLQVEAIKATLDNDEQKVGADIIRKALAYPLRLIASNAGVNGSVVMQKVLENSQKVPNYGYNASNDTYQDLMESGEFLSMCFYLCPLAWTSMKYDPSL